MKIDRLIGILAILLQQEKVTAPYLAEKFEVSRRTINRDVEDLCKAGIPLVTTRGAGGGISIMDGYKMNHTLLTSGDMNAILAGLRSLDSVSNSKRYKQLIEKLSGGRSNEESVRIDLASWHKQSLSVKIKLISESIEHCEKVSFEYFSPKGESSRIIEPYYLLFHWASWYVWGWCCKREDFRLFKLNRMTKLTATGERFEKRAAAPPDLSEERLFPHNYIVKAVFRPEYKWRLIEDYGNDCFEDNGDGRILFTFGFTDKESIISWILSFGDGAELLEPQELRAELMKFGERLRFKYS